MTPAKQRLVIIGLIALGIVFAGFFGVRALREIRHIQNGGFGPSHPPPQPSETDVELIRDWMTIPYIARTYGVSDRMLFKEIDIPEKGHQEKNLKELNEEFYPDQNGPRAG